MDTVTTNRTVVALFDDMNQAHRAVSELQSRGVDRNQISIIAGNESGRYTEYASGTGEVGKGAGAGAAIGGGLGLLAGLTALAIPGFGPVIAAGPLVAALSGAGVGAVVGGIIGGLVRAGVPEHDARLYEEGVRRGGVLVTVRAPANREDEVADILDRNGARDIDERAGGDRTIRQKEEPATPERISGERVSGEPASSQGISGERRIPVVEERLRVDKRPAERRGVRVYSEVRERPVEQEVTLRDEHVRVERRPTDRPATEADLAAFREGGFEVTEVREEPVVTKESRVVEEVVISREGGVRREKVHDTVRRTDVRVEETGHDEDYRADWKNRYSRSGHDYAYYQPAYQFGGQYANDARYRDREWNSVEPDLRRDWEARGHGKWDEFRDAIRHGWDKIRGRR